MAVKFRMQNCGVVAIMFGGGAIQATGLDLSIQDGRCATWYGPDDDHDQPRSILEYRCFVGIDGAEPGDVAASDGMIHIDGDHENGERLTIRGVGAIGKDENGNLDIVFDEPPQMIFYDYEDEDEEDEDPEDIRRPEMTPEVAEAYDNVLSLLGRKGKK